MTHRIRLAAKAAGLALALSLALLAQARPSAATSRSDPLPRDLEIQLALSSLPANLREHATVYVLDPARGFERARAGTNGFHAFVARTGDDAFRGRWKLTAYRDDVLYPISFDAAGARANMRVFFDAARMQARGVPPQRLKETIQQRYRSHAYAAPDRPGVSYMLSPILRTYVNPENDQTVATTNNPHLMHYAPNLGNDDIGGTAPAPEELSHFMAHGRWMHSPDPFVIAQGPHGFLIQHVGVAERDAIDGEFAEMLARLCKIKDVWCLPT